MYNRKKIMLAAWRLYRAITASFAECLVRAWAAAKTNAERIRRAAKGETVNTWYGWKENGYQVQHGEHAAFQLDLLKTDGSTYRGSFFTEGQVIPVC